VDQGQVGGHGGQLEGASQLLGDHQAVPPQSAHAGFDRDGYAQNLVVRHDVRPRRVAQLPDIAGHRQRYGGRLHIHPHDLDYFGQHRAGPQHAWRDPHGQADGVLVRELDAATVGACGIMPGLAHVAVDIQGVERPYAHQVCAQVGGVALDLLGGPLTRDLLPLGSDGAVYLVLPAECGYEVVQDPQERQVEPVTDAAQAGQCPYGVVLGLPSRVNAIEVLVLRCARFKGGPRLHVLPLVVPLHEGLPRSRGSGRRPRHPGPASAATPGGARRRAGSRPGPQWNPA